MNGKCANTATGRCPTAEFDLAWGQKVSPEFRDELVRQCKRLRWTPEHASWLMACIAFESGETFSPRVRNAAGSGATGLIQFMPATARGLGTTTEKLAAMTAEEQLHYVGEYFRPYAARIAGLHDMYMAILMPKYVSAPMNAVLFNEGTVAYRQNSGLDKNTDGRITKAEAAAHPGAKLVKGAKLSARVRWGCSCGEHG